MKIKKLKKLLFIALIVSLTAIFSSVLISCGQKPSPETPPEEPTATETITINKTETSLIIGQYEKLKVTLENNNTQVTWSSANKGVATVSSTGMVTAVSVGKSRITARAGDLSATCLVTVGLGEYVPTIEIENYAGDSVSIATVDTVNLSSVIKFNGKTYTDAHFSYTLSNNTIGEVTDGKFTPFKMGETTVTITAMWRGMTVETIPSLTKTFTIKVNKTISFLVNGREIEDIELYTRSTWGGKNFTVTTPFVPTAYIDGNAKPCQIAVIGTENIVEWDSNSLTALKKGETTLKLSCTDGQKEYSTRLKVTVLRPVANYSRTITGLSIIDGDIGIEEIFGDGAVLMDAYQGETPLEIRGNRALGIQTSRTGETTTQVTLYTQEVGYTVTIKGYTKIINDKEDLKIFEVKASSPFYDEETDTIKIDGYFYLANDITEKGETISHNTDYIDYRTSDYINPNGFYGILEGNGHKITFKSGLYGIFGNLVNNAVIRNVAFTDIVVDQNAKFEQMTGAGIVMAKKISAKHGATGSFENVYVGITDGVQIGIFGARPAWFDIKNIVIEYGEDARESSRGARGSLFGEDNYKADRQDNKSEDLNNVYIISSMNAPVDYAWSGGYRAYAKNQTEDPNYKGVAYRYSEVYQCSTRQELAQTIKDYNLNLRGFNSTYWDTSSGTPVWK